MPTQRIRVLVKSDGLSATVDIVPGDPVDKSALLRSLRDGTVKSGIDFETVDELATRLGNPAFEVSGRCMAQGKAATPGPDGKLELNFEIGLQPGTSRADGSIDLFDRASLKKVVFDSECGEISPTRLES